jgi:hypothetical protein
MSVYVDRFIKQHKEYFRRNQSFIENNSWDDSTEYSDRLEDLTNQLVQISEIKTKKARDKKQGELKKEITSLGDSHQKNKKELFTQESTLTSSILGRLSAFIKETEKTNDRQLNKVQKFVDFTVDIINLHIEKCNTYLNYNLDLVEGDNDEDYEIEYRGKEITFQDDIFKKKIGIEDTLNSLNITNSIENLQIEFFRDQKASIPMMEVLIERFPDIKELTDKLEIPTEIIDKEFFIYKNPKKIPRWNEGKHYWEQDKEVFKFWYNEWLKIRYGFEVDGYFFHPWLYFHLNFFKTPMPSKGGGDKIGNPLLRDNEWYIAEALKSVTKEDGYYTKAGVMLYGSRRIAKSTSMASICEWKATIVANVSTAITSGSEGDLGELTHKIRTSMNYQQPAFKLNTQKQEWSGGIVELGLKADSQTPIEHSRHTIKNLVSGAKKATQKTAGGAPSVYLIEEIGKFNWEKSYLAALPSFQSDFGLKTTIIAVGTGGESSLSNDAMKALSNPSTLKFQEMDWDMLESKIPKAAITWKRRKFAHFVPGQMGMKDGFKRIEKGFGDFLGIDSKELNKIRIFQTDWINNTGVLLADRKLVRNDNLKLQQEKVQYPIDPEECFLSAEENPFPSMVAKKHSDHLISIGEVGKPVDLYRDNDGKVCFENSHKEYPIFPFPGGHHDSPVTLYELPPEFPDVNNNLYIAGYDGYKHEQSDGDSLGSIVIYKRIFTMGEWDDRIVASLHTRPDPHSDFHKTCLMLLELYGAKCFPENEDMDFKVYLDKKFLTDKYLVKGFNLLADFDLNTNGNREFGWQPTAKNKRALLGQAIRYTKEETDTRNEEGEIIKTTLGIQRIPDLKILEEMINYKEGGNFDGITSFMSALAYAHWLDQNYISPDVRKKQEEYIKPRTTASRPFGGKRYKPF